MVRHPKGWGRIPTSQDRGTRDKVSLPEFSIHASPTEWVLKSQRTEILPEMAPQDERKGTNTLTSPFLQSSNILPVFPLGGPKEFQFPRESAKKPGVEVSL